MYRFAMMVLFLMLASPAKAEPKNLTICSFEWLPHHSPDLNDEGYTADIIRKVFAAKGYQVTKLFLPWKRAQLYAQEGTKCGAISEVYFKKERLEHYWFGAPYSVHEVYLIGLKSHPIANYDSLVELANYQFGFNRGGVLSSKFDAAEFLRKTEVDSYASGIKMLLNKHIDFFVSARSVAIYEASKLGAEDKIRTVGPLLQRQFVHIAFSKANPKNRLILQDYNEGLFLLLRSGRYTEILKKHGQ